MDARTPKQLAAVFLLGFLSLPLAIAKSSLGESVFPPRPKLVVLLVVDQMRSDTLTRFEPLLGPRGYRTLMKGGAYFPFAMHEIMHSMTGPGHAALLTGAYPSLTGIPSNVWYNRDRRTKEYCVEDPKDGISPRNLRVTTIGDELKSAGFQKSRVISIALKDRAAVLMGGHRADRALWFDGDAFGWRTSAFYEPGAKVPDYAARVNARLATEKGKALRWEPSESQPYALTHVGAKPLPDERNAGRIGAAFPHGSQIGNKNAVNLPLGIELTAELAELALTEERLGARSEEPDLLTVSFSSHDYLAHGFGPTSRELEELIRVEDRAIARLLDRIEKQVPGGLKSTLIVMTGDHGGPHHPDLLAGAKVPAGRIDENELRELLNRKLDEKWGAPSEHRSWIPYLYDFSLTLDPSVLSAKRIARPEIEEYLRTEILRTPGVANVVTRSDMEARKLPIGLSGLTESQFWRTMTRDRSGDLVIVPFPQFASAEATVDHVTGYSYDRHVPLIFMGAGIRPGVRHTHALISAIAPTLAAMLRITPPSGSEGKPLTEILPGAAHP